MASSISIEVQRREIKERLRQRMKQLLKEQMAQLEESAKGKEAVASSVPEVKKKKKEEEVQEAQANCQAVAGAKKSTKTLYTNWQKVAELRSLQGLCIQTESSTAPVN